jgi:hypothetical protein
MVGCVGIGNAATTQGTSERDDDDEKEKLLRDKKTRNFTEKQKRPLSRDGPADCKTLSEMM